MSECQRIAVIGTGIAGMGCAWLLARRHEVTLFERDSRVGGHSNTVDVPSSPDGGFQSARTPVDTGFIVYNELNYPELTALFRHLGVGTRPSSMTFAASIDDGRIEYSGSGLPGLFAQSRNLVSARHWRMLRDIARFYREAPAFIRTPEAATMTLGDYLERGAYSAAFVEDHLLPMGAAIWSTAVEEMRRHPAAAFLRFYERHGLLRATRRPVWRTVAGGSREYVRLLMADLMPRVRLSAPVVGIRRDPAGVAIRIADGATEFFDHVVVAAHADQALAMLSDASADERRILGAFRYTGNRAVLHEDVRLMPKRRRVWSSWNFLGEGSDTASRRVCVSYWMNRLQAIPGDRPIIVTLNPIREPDRDLIHAEYQYDHPFYDVRSIAAQPLLRGLQGVRRTWFCGSYFGSGFHEDALQSGLAVAEALGGTRRPWSAETAAGAIPPFATAA
jgi:predicted NAD/FAD-binding protein